MFSSCENNNLDYFKSLDLDFDGITAVKKAGDYIGEIPSSGLKFTIIGKGKLAKCAYINNYCIDSLPQNERLEIAHDYKPTSEKELTIKAEWGEIRNTTDNKVFISINPNNTLKSREFEFLVGSGYEISYVRIKQPPVKAE